MEINKTIILNREDLKEIITGYVRNKFGEQVTNISVDLDVIPNLDSPSQCYTPIFKSITVNIEG